MGRGQEQPPNQNRNRRGGETSSSANFNFSSSSSGCSHQWRLIPLVIPSSSSTTSGIGQSRYNPGAGALPLGMSSAAEPRNSTGRSQPIVTRASTSASAVLAYQQPLNSEDDDDDDDEPMELPFVCQAENCGRSFSSKKSMIHHQRYAHWLHKGCSICKDSGKGFQDWGLDSQTKIDSHFELMHPEMVSTKHHYIFSVFGKTGQLIDENVATYAPNPNQTFTAAEAAVEDGVSNGEINSLHTELNTQIDKNRALQSENVTIKMELQQSQSKNVKMGEEFHATKKCFDRVRNERNKLRNGVKQVSSQLQKMIVPDGSGSNNTIMPPPPTPPVISLAADKRKIAELEQALKGLQEDKLMLQDRCRDKDRIIARLRRERDGSGGDTQTRYQPYPQRRPNNRQSGSYNWY